MHNLDDMIEKYRQELLDFSKQKPVHIDDEYGDFVPVMAELTKIEGDSGGYTPLSSQPEEKSRQFESNATDDIRATPYANNEDFEMRNQSRGMLRVQVFASERLFPINGARVTVDVPFLNGSRELYSGLTDSDGIVDGITLPTPNKSLSLDEDNTLEPYARYRVRVTHPNFAESEYDNVLVYDSVKSIQPVELVPLTQSGEEPRNIDFRRGQ